MGHELSTQMLAEHRHVEADRPISRAFIVLQAIRESPEPVTLSALVRGTGLPKSTVHRLLAELSMHNVVCRRGDHYRLGTAILRLVEPCQKHLTTLRRAIKPVLIQLHARTRYMVGLGVPGELTVRFIDTAYDEEYSHIIERIEEASHLHTSAAGKILLAYHHHLVNLTTDTRREPNNSSMPVPPNLQSELAQIRLRQLATSPADSSPGIAAVAIPLLDTSGRPIAALSIGAYPERFDSITATRLLRKGGTHAQLLLRRCSIGH